MKILPRKGTPYLQADLRPWGLGQISTGTTDRAEAKQIARAFIAKHAATKKSKTQAIELSGLIDRYLQHSRASKALETSKTETRIFKALLKFVGDKPVKQIKPEDVVRWVNARQKKLCARQSIER